MDISTTPINLLSLCSGGGGLELGVGLAVPNARAVCYVENEVTACALLAQRMEENLLSPAPIWTDLRTFDAAAWRGVVDIVTGGYPCQPFSLAGNRAGESDPRHLWPFIAGIIRDCEPTWCFFENVPGHLTLGYAAVKAELEAIGYRVTEGLFSAAETGASHKRERLFILAYRDGVGRQQSDREIYRAKTTQHRELGGDKSACGSEKLAYRDGVRWRPKRIVANGETRGLRDEPLRDGEILADTQTTKRRRVREDDARRRIAEAGRPNYELADSVGQRLQGRERGGTPDERNGAQALGSARELCLSYFPPRPDDYAGWIDVFETNPLSQPSLCRMVDGLADWLDGNARVNRLRILGNGVVPIVAALAFAELARRMWLDE